jgi:molybdopterin converting factor small subunit
VKIKVRFGELLWRLAGESQVEMELGEGTTVADAIAHLYQAHPGLMAELAAEGKTTAGLPYYFFLNRKLVQSGEMALRRLKEGDTLYILSPTAGG